MIEFEQLLNQNGQINSGGLWNGLLGDDGRGCCLLGWSPQMVQPDSEGWYPAELKPIPRKVLVQIWRPEWDKPETTDSVSEYINAVGLRWRYTGIGVMQMEGK